MGRGYHIGIVAVLSNNRVQRVRLSLVLISARDNLISAISIDSHIQTEAVSKVIVDSINRKNLRSSILVAVGIARCSRTRRTRG